MTLIENALELRKALEFYASSLDADTDVDKILSIPSLFPEYAVGVEYKTKDIFAWGTNELGDIQLWQVLQNHTSSEEWTPDTATSLYKKIGISESGYPEWVQPLGATDAYNTGDIVSYKGTLYKSTIDANVWSPEAYPQGWEVYTPRAKKAMAKK